MMCDRAQALLQGGEKLADMRPLAIGRGQRTDKFHYDAICPAGFAVKALHGIGVERGIGMIQERVRNLQSDLQLDARRLGPLRYKGRAPWGRGIAPDATGLSRSHSQLALTSYP